MVTTDKPNLEKLLISFKPGILLFACSMGNVMSRSISVAPNEGAEVITCTWLSVMSGTASIGSLVN